MEASTAAIHAPPVAGISAGKRVGSGTACVSICVSGGRLPRKKKPLALLDLPDASMLSLMQATSVMSVGRRSRSRSLSKVMR